MVQFRLPPQDDELLRAISLYEQRDRAELLRAQVLRLKKEYRKDVSFRRWIAKHATELGERGVDVGEIL